MGWLVGSVSEKMSRRPGVPPRHLCCPLLEPAPCEAQHQRSPRSEAQAQGPVSVPLADCPLSPADAVRHAGDRHERLAEEHHLPALHQEQQTDPVVLAGQSQRREHLRPAPQPWRCPLSGAGSLAGCREGQKTVSTCSASSVWLWLAEAPVPPPRTAGSA